MPAGVSSGHNYIVISRRSDPRSQSHISLPIYLSLSSLFVNLLFWIAWRHSRETVCLRKNQLFQFPTKYPWIFNLIKPHRKFILDWNGEWNFLLVSASLCFSFFEIHREADNWEIRFSYRERSGSCRRGSYKKYLYFLTPTETLLVGQDEQGTNHNLVLFSGKVQETIEKYALTDSIGIRVDVVLERHEPVKKYDFTKPDDFSDVTLIVQEQKFHVSKVVSLSSSNRRTLKGLSLSLSREPQELSKSC